MHQIIVIIFATLSAMALTTAQISINGLTLPRSSINDMPTKRQQQEAAYQWPRVDGPPESFPPLDLLVVGYWTFNTTFLKDIEQLNSTDPIKAGETLLSGLVEYEYKWLDECWKTGNESAKANSQTNTLARVVVFPTDDPSLVIDPIYKLATPILLACWEREKDGDINVPIISHTQDLIFAFNWDKEYALNFIKNQQKDFTPVVQQDADINPPPKAGPPSSKPRASSPPEPNSSKSFKPLLEHILYISLFYIFILFII